jgi:type IV fimbrial biogenesis protein FimT
MLAKINRRLLVGVTLTEVMVVVVIIGVLLGMGAPSFADMLNRRRVQLVAETLSSDLAYARAEAGLGRPRDVNVQFEQPDGMSCYTIYVASVFDDCFCSRPPGAACTGIRVELRTVQVPSSMGVNMSVSAVNPPNQISFIAPRMTSSAGNFFVTVTGVRGSKLQVQVNAMGRVSVCVPPGGNFSGIPACPA